MKRDDFGKRVVAWFRENGRSDLPWRMNPDAYHVWVSEVILQQTRIAQGLHYYLRFTQRFPTVEALAAAPLDEVLLLWQGLGYYSRARNLHEAARAVAKDGGFPRDYAGVRALKGVGDYTAAAICSIVYKIAVPVVDGNVYRLLSRWGGVREAVDSTAGKKIIAQMARALIDSAEPGLYNEGAMELGETVCVPQNPHCTLCPLAHDCVALRDGLTEQLPLKSRKTVVKERFFTYLYVTWGDYTFVQQRSGNDIWKNLYEFPLIESPARLTPQEVRQMASVLPGIHTPAAALSITPVWLEVKHQLTHRTLYADFYHVELAASASLPAGWVQVAVPQLPCYAFPRLVTRFIEKYIKTI